ncbi:cytochrome P450 [Streptomyces sp. NBC_01387]|uniref:cytochrome P450 n=1 Tax=unclassified Streptomyces TaxID=2593676 RepID=UPI0020244D23|nr:MULTISPECIES: cytochrome P450 [unclassified Streptomyces]MCX4553521.1 cytochrome P450 [Streptomyces sp. NBC_01500]WSC18473.1 cytochrome P450 [Streptomyces sp. NBC_01766]WSV52514.1 cytochrome P450 [Streptomyces sp. NBC_01014]
MDTEPAVTADVPAAAGQQRLPEPLGAEFLARPDETLASIRETCPVVRIRTPAGRPAWLVTRADDVRAGFVDPRLSLSGGRVPDRGVRRRALDVTLVNYDPPDHTRIRRLATPALTPGRMAAHRERIERAARELLDAADAARGEGPVELMNAFARPFAFRSLCEVFEVREEERAALYEPVARLADKASCTAAAVEESVARIDAFVRGEMARRTTAPGDDVVTRVLAAWREQGGASEDEVASLLAMLLLAGFDSTVQAIGMSMVALLGHPEVQASLREEPSRVPRAVDELLRWDTPGPFSTKRVALEDIPFGDTVIPAGSGVLLSVAAANHDPRCHADPGTLDPDRSTAGRHLSFGLGPHYCPGSALARLELTVALTSILGRWRGLTSVVPLHDLAWGGGYLHRRLASLPVLPCGPG